MIGAPPERGGVGAPLARAVAVGVAISGLVAFIGQVAGFALFLALGARGSFAPFGRVGVLYLELFHRVSLTAAVSASIRSAASASGEISVRLGIGLLGVTAIAVALLAAAGRATTRRLGPRVGARAAVAAALAAAYALPVFGLSFLARGVVPIASNRVLNGRVTIGVVEWQALAFPLSIALAASLGGALLEREVLGRAADVVRGGVRAFALALLLSFAGLLVLATAEPSATRAYLSAVAAPNATGTAVLLAHHVLVLPNQSMWVLVPAMGGCDVLSSGGSTSPFLCYRRAPSRVGVDPGTLVGGPTGPVRFEPLPTWYLAFLLVPLVSCVAGGARAAGDQRDRRRSALLGAASGVVFAALVAAGCALSSVWVSGSTDLLGSATRVRASLGPDMVAGSLLGLAWGVVGGAAGGLLRRYDVGAGSTIE